MSQPSSGSFREIEVLRGDEGVAVVFTERLSNGRISFSLVREFEENGETRRTAFIHARHVDAAVKLLPAAGRRAEQLEDQARTTRRVAR